MRDQRFVAVHRGGLLSKEHHRLLIRWAHNCAEDVSLGSDVEDLEGIMNVYFKPWLGCTA